MFDTLLSLDRELLIEARGLVGPDYAVLIQILGESVVIVGASILIFLWFRGIFRKDNGDKVRALQIFFTVILTFIVYTIVNFGVPAWRPNPQEVVPGIGALIPHPLDNSFPSGHALFTISFLIGLIRFERKSILIGLIVVFGLLTAGSRVIGGVHYPGDILGGWILGGIGALILSLIVEKGFFRTTICAPIIRLASFFRL